MGLRILAILCVRNQAAFLLDWLAHHRACGVTDFLVFSNDCQDGTDTMLDRLQAMGLLVHKRNNGPYDARGIQFTALNRASDLPIVKRADWLLPLDVDEFVNVHVGDRSLGALIDALPDASAITLTWRLFGNPGIVPYEDKPVTEQFTRAAPEILNWPWRSAMFKTLYRNDGTYNRLGVHRPRQPDPARLPSARWFDSQGQELGEAHKTTRIFNNYTRPKYKLAQLNHYPLGAMESYLLKTDRGRAVHSDHMLGMDYWVERNYCTDEDTSILSLTPKVQAERVALAADSQLAQLHQTAVAWRKSRIQDLMTQEPYRALMGRLMVTPPSRPVPPPAARYLAQYARRAESAPEKPRRKP